jgi:hypothetical protein
MGGDVETNQPLNALALVKTPTLASGFRSYQAVPLDEPQAESARPPAGSLPCDCNEKKFMVKVSES